MVGIPSTGPRIRKGDIMSPEKRSAVMVRMKSINTGPERRIETALAELGLLGERQARDLPGRPDFVFREAGAVVFVDGDFWHGWLFPCWHHKVPDKWNSKIDANRRRDTRNHQRLRRPGWTVVRICEHQVVADIHACVNRVTRALASPQSGSPAWRQPT